MSISNYNELKTAIASWLARDDLTAFIPDFITLFEASACRELRVRPAETTATITPTSGAAALPADFLAMRRLTWAGSPNRDLEYVHPAWLAQNYPTSAAGMPAIYTIEGGTVKVRPVSDMPIDLLYRAKTPAVSGALNWLFTNHPDVYLFGSLAEAYMFNKDPENAALWEGRRDKVYLSIKGADFHYREIGAPRIAGYTP
jgi:hypothetical protein